MFNASPEDELSLFNPDKPVSLPGRRCAYCGREIDRRSATKDHVVGRNFVPEGTLASGFFLQVKTCRPCNDAKARLEDDISIITMLPDTAGRFARDDERLRRTVARKARGAISPATRRLVAESYNRFAHRFELGGGLSFNFDGVAMPTLDEQRIARLAFYHVQGFAHFRSFEPGRGYGAWLDHRRFDMLGHLIDADWGNPVLRHFMAETADWDLICLMNMADGYFRHVVRRKIGEELWSWALEWNGRSRIFGLYGDKANRVGFKAAIPPLKADFSAGDKMHGFAMRIDTPLPEGEDRLFALPEDFTEGPYAAPHWR